MKKLVNDFNKLIENSINYFYNLNKIELANSVFCDNVKTRILIKKEYKKTFWDTKTNEKVNAYYPQAFVNGNWKTIQVVSNHSWYIAPDGFTGYNTLSNADHNIYEYNKLININVIHKCSSGSCISNKTKSVIKYDHRINRKRYMWLCDECNWKVKY